MCSTEYLKLEQATSIDLQDLHRFELVARHLQDGARRQFNTMHASRLDPFVEGRDEV